MLGARICFLFKGKCDLLVFAIICAVLHLDKPSLKGNESSTRYLNDTIRFDVPSFVAFRDFRPLPTLNFLFESAQSQ